MSDSPELSRRASAVRFVLLDVDGVLADGSIHMHSDGTDGRSFYVRDGMAIRLGREAGLGFGILSGRESAVVTQRALELGITEVHQGVSNKLERLGQLVERTGVSPAEICYMGDDLIDIPVMRRVGFAAAPADAAPEALEAAHYVASRNGGRGAVREVVELILRAREEWDRIVGRLFPE